MLSLPLGLIVFGFALLSAIGPSAVGSVVNMHALILVGWGTIGILAVATPISTLKSLNSALWQLLRPEPSRPKLDAALILIASNRRVTPGLYHPLLAYGQHLWEQGVDAEEFGKLLLQKQAELDTHMDHSIIALKNLAKYPPALGMTGTVVGLISLFSKLNPENRGELGPSLALAMTATFYGLILANGLLMPLADRLQVKRQSSRSLDIHILETLLLINSGEPPSLVEGVISERAA